MELFLYFECNINKLLCLSTSTDIMANMLMLIFRAYSLKLSRVGHLEHTLRLEQFRQLQVGHMGKDIVSVVLR